VASFSPASFLFVVVLALLAFYAKKLCLSPVSCFFFLGAIFLLLVAVIAFHLVLKPFLWKNGPGAKFLDALHDADMERLKKLVERHPGLVHQKDELGVPLIHYTAHWGNFPALEYMVSKGANIHIMGMNRETLLHIASMTGNLPMIRFLVERGADISKRDDFGQTAIERASFGGKKSVEFLLSKGADVNVRTGSGRTPLHSAVIKGDAEAVKLLIAHGADVNAKDEEGGTPLHLAGNRGMASVLISHGADVNAFDNRGHTPLHRTLDMRTLAMVDLLLESGASITPAEELYYAVKRGDKTRIDMLLREQPGLSASPQGYLRGWTVIHEAAAGGNVGIVGLLISGGAGVNTRDQNGSTPLHEASARGNREVVALLLDNGALINARKEVFDEREHGMHGGETALHMAALKGDRELFDYLVSRGADPFLTDAEGNTAGKVFGKWME